MRASCAPYNDCFNFKQNQPFDVYIDQNPDDTIPIKYSSLEDVKKTIEKLEFLYKNDHYTHKRVKQVAVIMMVRLRHIFVMKHRYPNTKDIEKRYKLSYLYNEFLKMRTKIKLDQFRKQSKFKFKIK